jgi:uncharacterized protein with GYD domain
MPKYLLQVSYGADGAAGVLKQGGSARRAAAARVVASAGGTLEAFYFALGDTDAFVIADLPDNTSMAAISLMIKASGALAPVTTALLTPEEVDAAVRMTPEYQAPGSYTANGTGKE